DQVVFGHDVPLALADLMFDPQTSGGLLLAMRENELEQYLSAMRDLKEEAWPIGRVLPFEGSAIKVI
ncbi:MAG TPA: selenide, water dikinase SelD, partial [Clostridia bacterium]|nr:selenide, water dikinase SelD [Clostridia bacterium]